MTHQQQGEKDKQEIERLLRQTSSWNHGHGLVVPPYLAKILKEMGIKENYTINEPMPRG